MESPTFSSFVPLDCKQWKDKRSFLVDEDLCYIGIITWVYNTDGNAVKDFTDLSLQIWELNKHTGNFYSDPTSVF